jgi:TolB-like protein/Flp pilus assembly protein TadD
VSLIEGFKYDIFISYRQNDNRYDGWVTEFVSNLKKELEATVKEKLTVYFDENPLDGLLDTQSVDKSLSEKLNCVIFIPVISQTYCDPQSYAWNNEFCVFSRGIVNDDNIGKNVKLANGNFASRILAVRIHDLDPDDRFTIEKETGEKLRSIDFIYRSAGVNRPLRAMEDHPGFNLNKTYYRDQINKVANAIKDIITVLRKKDLHQAQVTGIETKHLQRAERKFIRGKILFTILIILVIGGSAVYFLSHPVSNVEKSIAILPFINNSPNDTNTYFINGIMEEILSSLQKIKDIRTISRTSVEKYRNSSLTIPQIARELGVNYIVEGSGQKFGNSFRLNVQLVKAKKETHLWGKLFEQKVGLTDDIIKLQSSIAQSIVSELEGTITPQERNLIEKIPTANLTAYDFFQKGREELSKFWTDVSDNPSLFRAEKLFRKALEYDPRFAEAIVGQAEVYWYYKYYLGRKDVIDSVLMLTDIALSIDDKISDAYVIKGWCYDDEGKSNLAHSQYMKAIQLNPNDWKAYFALAELYDFDDPVKSLTNLQKAASLTHGVIEMPTLLRHIGGELLITGFFDKSRQYFMRAFELDGDSSILYSCLGGIEHNQANYEKAIEYYENAVRIKKNYYEVIHDLALYTQITGRKAESLKYYRQLESEGQIYFNMHRVAYTLSQNGFRREADIYFRKQIKACNDVIKNGSRSDLIYYSYYDLAGIYAFRGDKNKAYEYLRLANQSQNCFTHMLTLVKNDPMMKSMQDEPEFTRIVDQMESKFNRVHEIVGLWLEENPEF